MPTSHRRQGPDKTVLSCLVLSVSAVSVNRIDDMSGLSATKNFETVLSSLEMRRGLLTTVLSCRQLCLHHRQEV